MMEPVIHWLLYKSETIESELAGRATVIVVKP